MNESGTQERWNDPGFEFFSGFLSSGLTCLNKIPARSFGLWKSGILEEDVRPDRSRRS
jgi:hypothetical protein